MTTLQELPSDLVSEIWQVMYELANPNELNLTVRHLNPFEFECEGDEENDSPESDQKWEIKDAANSLAKMGDQLTADQKKKNEEDNLVQEIVAYLQDKSKEIDEKLGPQLTSSLGSIQSLFSNPFWSVIYGSYRTRMEGFIGSNNEVTEIALVSHITKGIASSTGISSSLVASLSTQFIIEKFGGYLRKSGSLVKIASSATE